MTDICCDRPAIGAVVHYVGADYIGAVRIPCLPAIVTDYCGSELELTVIDHGDMFVVLAAHSHGAASGGFEPRTWHSADPAVCDGGFVRR